MASSTRNTVLTLVKLIKVIIWISVHAKGQENVVGRPNNIKCQFLARKYLTCQFEKTKGIDYNCSVGGHTGFRYDNISCKDENSSSPDSQNECRFECEETTICTQNNNHMLKISWNIEGRNYYHCVLANSSDVVKPGPVTDMEVKALNKTAVNVKWKKPSDNGNYDPKYVYLLNCGSDDIPGGMSEVCSPLRPGTKYNISVRAKPPKKRGFKSDAVVKTVFTPEDVPTSGAMIDRGAFSVVGPSQVMFYPREIPKAERHGQIVNQSVDVDSCSDVSKSTDLHWILIELSSCHTNTNIIIRTKAGTKVGWSNASMATFDMESFSVKHIKDVKKTESTIQWNVTEKNASPQSFTVHRCYGYQDKTQPQLVKCKTHIKSELVGSAKRYQIPELDPERVACRSCAWHFAVSGRVGNDVTGMVWIAPNATESAGLTVHTDNTNVIALVIVLVIFVPLAFVVFGVYFLKKKNLCKMLDVILPDLKDDVLVQSSADEKQKKRQHRDSGNGSMESELEENEKSKLISNCSNPYQEDCKPHLEVAPDTKPEPLVVEQNQDNAVLSLICDQPQKETKSCPSQSLLTVHLPEPEPIETKGDWDCSTESIVSIYRQVPNLEASMTQGGLEKSQVTINSPSLSNARPFRLLQNADLDQPQQTFVEVNRSRFGNRRQICMSDFLKSGNPQNSQPGLNAFPRCTSLPVGLSVLGRGANRTDIAESCEVHSTSGDSISKSAASYSTVDIS